MAAKAIYLDPFDLISLIKYLILVVNNKIILIINTLIKSCKQAINTGNIVIVELSKDTL